MLQFKYENNIKDETIILIHPFGGNNRSFKKQLVSFNKFYNTLCIDLNGHGLSKNIKLEDKPRNWIFMADQIIEVMDYLCISKAHFMGASLGTLVISSISINYPNRIASIISIGNATIPNGKLKSSLPLVGLSKHILSNKYTYKLFANLIIPGKSHKISRSFLIKECMNLGPKEFFAWYELVISFYKNSDYNSLINNIPTLFIMGDKDSTFLNSTKKLSNLHSKSNIVIISAGHLANIDAPNIVNELSLDFYIKNSYLLEKEVEICV